MELILMYQGNTGVESGTNSAGQPWTRTTAIFKTVDERQTTYAPTCLGNMVDVVNSLTPGGVYRVKMDVESKLYEGKYFHDMRAWSIKPAFQAPAAQQPAAPAAPPADWDTNPDPL